LGAPVFSPYLSHVVSIHARPGFRLLTPSLELLELLGEDRSHVQNTSVPS
jgi:hypothetical protein